MLKKIALCASVLTLSALGGASGALAYEAPADSFYPAAGWDLSRMPSNTGAGEHCLLVTEYNNGFFVQFQGKNGALDLISIDLRQAAFQEGQSVPVTLTIPGRTAIPINGRAFNQEIVTLDMSGQDTLLDTLRSASAMDIDIAGSAFRFFLTGFTNALQGFDRCNQGAPQAVSVIEEEAPAIVEEPSDETPERPSTIASGEPLRSAPSENMRRRQEKEQEIFNSEIARIMPREESVTANLQRQMAESGETLVEVKDTGAPAQRPASRFTEQLAAEMGTAVASSAPAEPVRSISAERMARTQAQADDTINSPPDTQNESGQQEKSLIEDLKSFVSGEPEATPAPETTSPAAPAVIAEFSEETFEVVPEETIAETPETEMTPEPAAPTPERIASSPEMQVTKTISYAEADFTDMPARSVDAAPAVPPAMSDRRLSELEAKLGMLQRENEALNAELEMSLRSSEQERLEISSDNWNLEQATMRYNEAERQIAQLGQQVQKERAQCAVEKKELEMMLFDPQVTEQAQLGHLAKLEDELDAARAEIRVLRAQLGN